ncbi:MAG: chemotaxis protein CheR [Zoogloeaceae bacterium]|jgi:chemotaxis protein methyltransferase CheR|nr:chemotaxis protein CheR [Zoogloeaceae bacterium]
MSLPSSAPPAPRLSRSVLTPAPTQTLTQRLAAIRQATNPAASDANTLTREFSFQNADFERVRKLIYAKAGISLSSAKQDMVYSRLSRRLRATGKKTFSEYLDFLEQRKDAAEWEHFVNALTTNLTSFFREPHHFPALSAHLRHIAAKRKQINIWCCAASTGEEPYSIAMTVADTFTGLGGAMQISILCSDLDTNVLATAEKGAYFPDRVEKIPPEQLRRYFSKGTGSQEGMFCVKPELRRMLTFRRLNLLDSVWPVKGPLDVIFCRNVMIYFDKPTQYKILSRFAPMLQPDGLLFAGHSESFLHASDLFHSLGKTVYELAAGYPGHTPAR